MRLLLVACCASLAAADFSAPSYTVDLDLPAEKRWQAVARDILAKHGWENSWKPLFEYLNNLIPLKDWKESDKLLLDVLYKRFPDDIKDEVRGLWEVVVETGNDANCTESQIAFMQLYYEIDNFCTSIVAQNTNGTIFHGK